MLIQRILSGLLAMGLFSSFGIAKPPVYQPTAAEIEEHVILIDYFERVVGTPEEQPYFEMVLSAYSETELLLDIYTEGDTPQEEKKSYIVPLSAYTDAAAVFTKHGMKTWNDRDDCYGITGKYYVCNIKVGDQYIRVTSEHMPEDGKDAFYAVQSALQAYAKPAYLQQ